MSSIGPAVSALLDAQKQETMSTIQFALAAKQLDTARKTGESIVNLLNNAAQLSKSLVAGSGFDAIA